MSDQTLHPCLHDSTATAAAFPATTGEEGPAASPITSPPSFHLPFRTIAKKHRKTLFGLLLTVGALHLLPVCWQSESNRKGMRDMTQRTTFPKLSAGRKRYAIGKGGDYHRGGIVGMAPSAAAGGADREQADQKGPLDVGEKRDDRTSKRRKVFTTSATASAEHTGSSPKPKVVWLEDYTAFPSMTKWGPTFGDSSGRKVTLSGSMGSDDIKELMTISSCGVTTLTNPTILWKPTSASSTAAGIWLDITKQRADQNIPTYYAMQSNLTVLILFKAPDKQYALAEEVKFSIKPDDAKMEVKAVPRGYINFPNDTSWRTNFKWRASSPQPNEELEDTSLSIIYFAAFVAHAIPQERQGSKMEVSDMSCTHDPLDQTFYYTVTLKMDENMLRIALNRSRRILLLRGRVCKKVRIILLEIVSDFNQLFSQPQEEMSNSGSEIGFISITLQIPLLDFNDRNQGKLENHVFQSETRNCIIDDTQSTFKKNGSTPSFTVYELIRISSASEK
eukprot:GHVS01101887.1.p1 GENE.GHVS01101887.1~~GHVS01101887.1.p1  ORF type:complete len:504 (+),score=48.05 GHVS01101887.1:106-1617(+)